MLFGAQEDTMRRAVDQFHNRVTENWLGHAGAAAPAFIHLSVFRLRN